MENLNFDYRITFFYSNSIRTENLILTLSWRLLNVTLNKVENDTCQLDWETTLLLTRAALSEKLFCNNAFSHLYRRQVKIKHNNIYLLSIKLLLPPYELGKYSKYKFKIVKNACNLPAVADTMIGTAFSANVRWICCFKWHTSIFPLASVFTKYRLSEPIPSNAHSFLIE